MVELLSDVGQILPWPSLPW